MLKRTLSNSRKRLKTEDALTDTMVGDHSVKSHLLIPLGDLQLRSPEKQMVSDSRAEGKRQIKKTPKMQSFKIQIDQKPNKK